MAWIHMHRPLAAEETFATSSTCISGMTMYFEIFLITSGFMLSLSYPFNLSRNCASPRTRFASSQSTFERSSMMQMPSMVILTAGAGDLNALTSEMSFFVSELSAFTAEFSAGMATSRSACASSAMALTSALCFFKAASSAATFSRTTSASAWSMATCFSITSAPAAFSSRTGCSCVSSARRPSTMPSVSVSLRVPVVICSIFKSTWACKSFNRPEYMLIRSKYDFGVVYVRRRRAA
mmetsp:Transcript_17785/g.59988  ORF Transcript_17785/g.59988 Transcript_17785/m.59988 type:complete len:237 (-) Transcript_17785:2151-2861(-)